MSACSYFLLSVVNNSKYVVVYIFRFLFEAGFLTIVGILLYIIRKK